MSKPDYARAKRQQQWSLYDAAFWLSGMEPLRPPDEDRISTGIQNEIYEDLKDATELGHLPFRKRGRFYYMRRVVPGDCVTWAASRGYKIPNELRVLLNSADRTKPTKDTEGQPAVTSPPEGEPKTVSKPKRIEPRGGDSITSLIWNICYDLRDSGKSILPKAIMAELRNLASKPAPPHPLVGSVTGGVKYEYDKGDEKELTPDLLRKRIKRWKEANTGT